MLGKRGFFLTWREESNLPSILLKYENMVNEKTRQLKKSTAIIILAIIILVVIAGVIFLVVEDKESNNSFKDNVNRSTVINATNINFNKDTGGFSIKNDFITGDIILNNSEYNYQVRFPSNWNLDEISSRSDSIALFDDVALAQEVETELIKGMKIEIFLLINNYDSLEKFVDSQTENYGEYLVSRKEVEIDGQPAVEIITFLLGYNITTFVVSGDNLITVIGYIGDYNKREKYTNIYNNIINSFQFL